MDSDQSKSQLPDTTGLLSPPAPESADSQGATGFLPRSETMQLNEKIYVAREEGFDPLAIDLSLGSYETSPAHKLLLLGFVVIAAALVVFLFPTERFFKPLTRELGTMSIGGPVGEENRAFFSEHKRPWLNALLEMDRLYFVEGKLTEAIQVAEENLARVSPQDRESWRNVHYRYWELLADAGKASALKTATQTYLQALPEDPFANYYAAQAFIETVEPMRSFTLDMRQNFRLEAETLAQQIEYAGNALKARQKAEGSNEKRILLQNLYQKLQLQRARLFALIWRLGGYREDRHPDVVFRDKALDILDQDDLINLKEGKMLKSSIYNHILDRWYWFEGQQVIQGNRQNRRAMVEALKRLQKELKTAETL